MRTMFLAAAAILVAGPAMAQQTWIAACQGGKDAQYTQTVDGQGSFNIANGDGTYATVPVKQTFYNGAIVCGATGAKGESQIAEVCADTNRNVIAVMSTAQISKGVLPENATIYCEASVSVH